MASRNTTRRATSHALWLALCGLAACSGRSKQHVTDDPAIEAGTAGSGATGGNGTGGTGADGGTGAAGTGADGGTGANGGTGGTTGGVGGTTGGASGSGATAGHAGSGFAGDPGDQQCQRAIDAYYPAVQAAKACDPAVENPCTERMTIGLQCGCPEFVNPDNTEAIAELTSAASAYASGKCASPDVACGPCANAIGANCSEAGLCETVPDNGGAGCKLNGVVYSHGATGLPDPIGCGSCSCDDGDIRCTEPGCPEPRPEPCAPDEVWGRECALCGPADECQLLEYGCFESCEDNCAREGAVCVNGACITFICG